MTGVTVTMFNTFLIVALASASILVPSQPSAAPPGGNSQNGKKVFEKLGCYGSAGEGMPQTGKESAPPKIAATHRSLEDFVRYVRAPKGQMPPFSPAQATDDQLSDVYAFLQTVASQPKIELPSSANPQSGQRLYSAFGCYECHGLQGQGSTQTGGPRIGPPQIPFSGFVAYVREPANQMPPYTSKAVSDAQLADMYVFLQTRPQALPSKNIPLLNQ